MPAHNKSIESQQAALDPLNFPAPSLTLDVIRAAHRLISPRIHRTPVITCASLDHIAGAQLFFKCENLRGKPGFAGPKTMLRLTVPIRVNFGTHKKTLRRQDMHCGPGSVLVFLKERQSLQPHTDPGTRGGPSWNIRPRENRISRAQTL